MRKVIFGASVFFSGLISIALLLAGTMGSDLIVNGERSSFLVLSQFGLLPALFVFAGVAVVGLVVALIGLFGHEHVEHHEHHTHREKWTEE